MTKTLFLLMVFSCLGCGSQTSVVSALSTGAIVPHSTSTQIPLVAPTHFSGTPGNGSVSLSWDADSSKAAIGYEIYRATGSDGSFALVGTSPDAFYVDLTAVNDQSYRFKVRQVDSKAQEGPFSPELSLTPSSLVIGVPTGLVATGENSVVHLSWQAVSGAIGYSIYRSTSPGAEVYLITTGDQANFDDYAVSNLTTYFYVVTAVSSVAESARSKESLAMPAIPTGDGFKYINQTGTFELDSASASSGFMSVDVESSLFVMNGVTQSNGGTVSISGISGNQGISLGCRVSSGTDGLIVTPLPGVKKYRIDLHCNQFFFVDLLTQVKTLAVANLTLTNEGRGTLSFTVTSVSGNAILAQTMDRNNVPYSPTLSTGSTVIHGF